MLKPTAKEAAKAGVGQKIFIWQEGQVWIELIIIIILILLP
jgi:hypothetical protein